MHKRIICFAGPSTQFDLFIISGYSVLFVSCDSTLLHNPPTKLVYAIHTQGVSKETVQFRNAIKKKKKKRRNIQKWDDFFLFVLFFSSWRFARRVMKIPSQKWWLPTAIHKGTKEIFDVYGRFFHISTCIAAISSRIRSSRVWGRILKTFHISGSLTGKRRKCSNQPSYVTTYRNQTRRVHLSLFRH